MVCLTAMDCGMRLEIEDGHTTGSSSMASVMEVADASPLAGGSGTMVIGRTVYRMVWVRQEAWRTYQSVASYHRQSVTFGACSKGSRRSIFR